MTVRAALGASRWQTTRQLLAESLLLAAAGGVVALPAAWLALRFLISFQFDIVPNVNLLSIDWGVLVFNFALALSTGVIFGLLPAWQACRAPAGDALKAASRAHTAGPQQRLRSLLVIVEIAFTVILTTGAGLMLRSFLSLRAMRIGYDTRGVLTGTVDLGDTRSTEESVTRFFDNAVAKARALPGVSAAAAVSFIPASPEHERTYIHFSDRPDPQNGVVPIVVRTCVTPDYFHTMRIPLIAGRLVRDSDTGGTPKVAIIDERAARQYWPGRSPVGERIWIDQIGPDEKIAWRQIVGVVGSVTIAGGLDPAVRNIGEVYLPESQYSDSRMTVVLRTSGNPAALADPLRRIIREVDIDQPLFGVQTLEDAVATGRASQKLALSVLAIFGVIALLVSAIGIYGVMAFSVSRRWHEFGIRMSLGARPRDVLKLVTRQAFLLNAVGVAIGLAGAWALTGLMSSLLYSVRASDPATFAASVAFLAVVTMLAAYVPARRATRVDPAEALREE
jgi:putative ABC transport system permease protein